MSAMRIVMLSAIGLVACGGAGGADAGGGETPQTVAPHGGNAGAPGAAGAPIASGGGATGAAAGAGGAAETACVGGHELHKVGGSLVGDDGAPIADGLAQTCLRVASGKAICVKPEPVAADGAFHLAVPEAMQCVTNAVLRVRASKAPYATLYCALDGPPDLALSPLTLAKVTPAISLPPEGDGAAPRAIGFDDGLVVETSPDALASPNGTYADLGARRATPDARCFPGGPVEGAYAFHPEMNVAGGTGPIRIPNATHLAPGTEVDLLVIGGLSCMRADGSPIEEGTVERFSSAKVDPTGAFLEGGSGLPCLTWLAYRKK